MEPWDALQLEIQERVAVIESDARLRYPDASVQINAPLALVQLSLKVERDALKRVLELMEKY